MASYKHAPLPSELLYPVRVVDNRCQFTDKLSGVGGVCVYDGA